ncbi:hypothetical protein C4K25_2535 [Pseudomonas chlororaphis]|nr:hypothetical protein C4K25_2535 [Pseudomonas chlororaphis]
MTRMAPHPSQSFAAGDFMFTAELRSGGPQCRCAPRRK